MLYDITSPTSIEQHAKLLENKAIYEVVPNEFIEKVNKKGGIGTLIEVHHFGYKPNSKNEADFPEAGVELKITPYRKNKRGTFSAKERLVLNIINYMEEYKHSFEDSSFWKKNKLLLLIFYLYDENLNRHDFKFTHSQLFEFHEKDLEIIKKDWEIITDKIKEGRAHDLSEKDTVYLSAATKGANENSLRNQPFSGERAMQRAFSLKSSYMTFILNQYILNRKKTYQPILDTELAKIVTIDDYIINSIRPNLGKRLSDLCVEFGIAPSNKSKTQQVIARMVSKDLIDLNKSEEFIKSNTKIKAIRIQKNSKVKESMSFPSFKYKEIIQEDWEDSSLRLMFQETRYLFTLYVETKNDDYELTDAFFWSLPEEDLEEEVRSVWEETVNRIMAHRADRLPGSSENRVAHVRPHAANSEDTYPTHYGANIVKKCFWLNNSYILGEVLKNSPITKNRLPK